MKSALGFVAFVLIGQVILLALGIGEGFSLHWAIPAIDLGTAIVACVLTAMMMAYMLWEYIKFVVRNGLARQAAGRAEEASEDEDVEDEDDQFEDDEVGEIVVEPLGSLGGYRISSPATRRRKQRKRR